MDRGTRPSDQWVSLFLLGRGFVRSLLPTPKRRLPPFSPVNSSPVVHSCRLSFRHARYWSDWHLGQGRPLLPPLLEATLRQGGRPWALAFSAFASQEKGRFKVIGQVLTKYSGIAPNDSSLDHPFASRILTGLVGTRQLYVSGDLFRTAVSLQDQVNPTNPTRFSLLHEQIPRCHLENSP